MLVLDVMLPKRSGFEVLKQIRADEVLRDLPVLILTAKGQAQDRRTAEELGADGFVTKPYANAEVVDAVRRLLGPEPTAAERHGPAQAHQRARCSLDASSAALLILPPLVDAVPVRSAASSACRPR